MNSITWNDIPWSETESEILERMGQGDALPGFIIAGHQQSYSVVTPLGIRTGVISGRLAHLIELGTSEPPAVGDYVGMSAADEQKARIDVVLPRRNSYRRRKSGGEAEAQVIAANLDYVCILTAADGDLSSRRIERYLANMDVEAASQAIVLITKADIADDPDELGQRMAAELPDTDVRVVSVYSGYGMDRIPELHSQGARIVLVGSSGCGKSTLINHLCRAEQARTAPVRSGDDKGRHTTTTRQVYLSPDRALLIDTPGMREVGLWAGDRGDALSEAFPELTAAAEACRYRDCNHTHEPGCGVLAAVDRGEISRERYESYLALRDELNTSEAQRRERKRQFMKRVAKLKREWRKS